jgi:hypothetical protein
MTKHVLSMCFKFIGCCYREIFLMDHPDVTIERQNVGLEASYPPGRTHCYGTLKGLATDFGTSTLAFCAYGSMDLRHL